MDKKHNIKHILKNNLFIKCEK